jgi:hypothetical protein
MKWRRGDEGRMEVTEGRPWRMDVLRMAMLPFWLSCCGSCDVRFCSVIEIGEGGRKDLPLSNHPASGVIRKKPLCPH